MAEYAEFLDIVYRCAQELNKQLPPESRLSCSEDTLLVDTGSVLDSLGMITLSVNVEQEVANLCGVQLGVMDTLMTEHPEGHPLATMSSTAHWIAGQVNASQP